MAQSDKIKKYDKKIVLQSRINQVEKFEEE